MRAIGASNPVRSSPFVEHIRIPSTNRILGLVIVAALGFAFCQFSLPLSFGVDLVFTSIPGILAVLIAGPVWGGLVAIPLASLTIGYWGHPYAFIVFSLEILWVGWWVGRYRSPNLLLADLGYWLAIGAPLVFLFYRFALDLPSEAVTLVALKQSLNGILNVALALLLTQFTPLQRLLSEDGPHSVVWRITHLLPTILISAVLLLGALAISLSSASLLSALVERESSRADAQLIELERDFVTELDALGQWAVKFSSRGNLNYVGKPDYSDAPVSGVLGLISERKKSASADRKSLEPCLIRLVQGSFSFCLRDSDTEQSAYRLHVHELSHTDVEHVVALAQQSIAEWVERLAAQASGGIVVLKRHDGRILAGSNGAQSIPDLQPDGRLMLATVDNDLPAMVRWQRSFVLSQISFGTTSADGKLALFRPLNPVIQEYRDFQINALWIGMVMTLLASLGAWVFARWLLSPLETLEAWASSVSTDANIEQPKLPVNCVWEARSLVNSVRLMSKALHLREIERDEEIEHRMQHERELESAVQDLTAARSRVDAIIASALDGVVCMDWSGIITEFNPAAEQIFGYSRAQVVGQELSSVMIPPSGRAAHKQGLAVFRETGEGVVVGKRLIVTAMRADGSTFPCELAVTEAENVEPSQFMATLRDVTERRETEARVIQASKMATLGEMATSMAHELNQPLNVMRMACGNLDLRLERGSVETEYVKEKIGRIAEQIARAATIIDHMRVFGRKEQGTELSLVDLNDPVEGALSLVRSQLTVRNIALDVRLGEELPLISGNSVHLEQIILNLLVNARDALDAHESTDKTITISAIWGSEFLTLGIEDNGPGIDEAISDRVFEPFFTTKQPGQGTGLGLSISYGLLKEMGGRLSYVNLNPGCRFELRFPLEFDPPFGVSAGSD